MKKKASTVKIEAVLARKTWLTKEEIKNRTVLSDKTITDGLMELEKLGRLEVTISRGKKMVRLKSRRKFCPVMSFRGIDKDRYQDCIEEECGWWNKKLQQCGPTVIYSPR